MADLRDMKESLGSARKADTTHVRKSFMIYTTRPCEFGEVKYERANFLRALYDASADEATRTRADFKRFRSYLRAARDHLSDVLDSMELHQSFDPHLEDVAGMRRAAYAVDTDSKPGCQYGPSFLPHVAPACASLNMAVTQAVHFGLLPADPGQPWREGIVSGWGASFALEPQQGDPALEAIERELEAAAREAAAVESQQRFADIETRAGAGATGFALRGKRDRQAAAVLAAAPAPEVEELEDDFRSLRERLDNEIAALKEGAAS